MKLLLWNTSVISIKKLTIIHEFSFFKLHLRRKTFIDMSNCNRGSRKLLVLFGQPTKGNWRGMLEKRGWGGGGRWVPYAVPQYEECTGHFSKYSPNLRPNYAIFHTRLQAWLFKVVLGLRIHYPYCIIIKLRVWAEVKYWWNALNTSAQTIYQSFCIMNWVSRGFVNDLTS